ncbi:helix-turn-helix transcriptional regulator, partial [Achromobacter denitrificans]
MPDYNFAVSSQRICSLTLFWRTEAGWTQAELAERLGVSRQAINAV